MSDYRQVGTEAEKLPPEQHIDPDDERYRGFRIKEYWLATTVAPDDQEAPLGVWAEDALRFHLSIGPAMASDQRRLRHLREYAAHIAKEYAIEVRIRHFVPEGEPEVIKP